MNTKIGYIPREKRKKLLLLCDDIRFTSGISTVAREMVIGTAHVYNWINLGGAVDHPDKGKKLDLNEDTNKFAGITDSSIFIYPTNGYGDPDSVRLLLEIEKPDAIVIFTDPRYWIWLFQMEQEIRQKIPIIYLNIWDDLPYPMYNKSYYESCDTLMAISKQTCNINKVVLGEGLSKEKIIRYVPHGINENFFYPITSDKHDYLTLSAFKNNLFKRDYKYKLLYNARNIRRKSTSDILLAWKIFIDTLTDEEASECILVLHTQPIDDNGTNLLAVSEMLFGNNQKYNIMFHDERSPVQIMNLLYNACDTVILTSSNEGWGLSLTEGMMCGKPIIATVTGGMQDQMRFEDEEGNWIEFTEQFGSNHRGKYKKHGIWAFPVFPSNISLIGSVPTPYIFDDRADPKDIALQINATYSKKIKKNQDEWEEICEAAYAWVMSDESKMCASKMCETIIETINETFEKFEPRHKWELIETKIPQQPKHYVKYPIAY